MLGVEGGGDGGEGRGAGGGGRKDTESASVACGLGSQPHHIHCTAHCTLHTALHSVQCNVQCAVLRTSSVPSTAQCLPQQPRCSTLRCRLLRFLWISAIFYLLDFRNISLLYFCGFLPQFTLNYRSSQALQWPLIRGLDFSADFCHEFGFREILPRFQTSRFLTSFGMESSKRSSLLAFHCMMICFRCSRSWKQGVKID